VSRQAPPAALAGQIPGMGPSGRALATGGRLLVREKDGHLRELVPAAAFFDVSDPAVSFDGTRVAFAGLVHPDSAWRIWIVHADGSDLAPVTHSDRALDLSPLGPGAARRFARYDDLDPVWRADGRLSFASTRFPQVAQQGGGAVTNLFVVRADGSGLERITTERNGAEEASCDPRNGRLVYARWLFSPYLPSDDAPGGLTTDRRRAVPSDSVDLWQAISVLPNGDLGQLAGGAPRVRRWMTAYAPEVLADGTLVGLWPTHGALLPDPGPTTLVAYPGGFAEPKLLAGAERGPDPRARAADPAALPDGRVVFALDPDGRGDFGLCAVRPDGTRLERVLDLPGTLELDPQPLVRRPTPVQPVAERGDGGGVDDPAEALPATRIDQVRRLDNTFRFDCLNVYLTGPVDSPFPDAPRIGEGVRIRFYGLLARPDAAYGDTAVLIREGEIDRSGAIHQHDAPGDVPLFEQLVDAAGCVLRAPRTPAHVPGSNFSRVASGTKCVGCHAGHSAVPATKNNLDGKWFNASPSARVTASSVTPGAGSPAALVDRRARGPVAVTGWLAGEEPHPAVRLSWPVPIEARSVILYAPSPDVTGGPRLTVTSCDLILYRDGAEVGRQAVRKTLDPLGTRIDFPPVRVDALEIWPLAWRGTAAGHSVAALAEVETVARLIED
jgi:hypothetical protein